MATLTNTKIKDTYDGLLKTTDNQAIDASGVTLIEDGLGNASALSVGRSGNGVTITGTTTSTAFAGNLTGNVTGNLTGTVLTAAQTNITSVGTLSSLVVSGNITVGTSHFIGDNAFDSLLLQSSAGENILLDAQDDLLLQTSGTTKLVVKNGGNVGIGTSSPASLLHLVEDSGQARLLIESPSGQNSFVGFQNTGGTQPAFLIGYNATDSACVFYDDIANTERMRIDSSGRVGIGTTSPSAPLEVNVGLNSLKISGRDTYIDSTIDSANANIYVTQTGVGDFSQESGHLVLQARTQGTVYRDIIFAGGLSNGEALMTILGQGNVGIGVSPSAKLHVNGPAGNQIRYTSPNVTNIFGVTGTDEGTIGTITNHPLTFSTNGSERMRILSSGGLTFNGDTAAANALDDYEEGTWTPVVTGVATNPSVTYTTQTGKYTKIGNVVHFFATLAWSAFSGGSGALKVSLPFTAAATIFNPNVTLLRNVNIADTAYNVIFEPTGGSATGIFIEVFDNAGSAQTQVSAFGATSSITINGHFYV
jgi:hypothetical protein